MFSDMPTGESGAGCVLWFFACVSEQGGFSTSACRAPSSVAPSAGLCGLGGGGWGWTASATRPSPAPDPGCSCFLGPRPSCMSGHHSLTRSTDAMRNGDCPGHRCQGHPAASPYPWHRCEPTQMAGGSLQPHQKTLLVQNRLKGQTRCAQQPRDRSGAVFTTCVWRPVDQ